MGLPDDLQHLSATRSTMDSTYSSTDTLTSRDFGDSDDRSATGSSASTSASASSQDGAGTALSTSAKAVLQTTPGHSNNGAGALLIPSPPPPPPPPPPPFPLPPYPTPGSPLRFSHPSCSVRALPWCMDVCQSVHSCVCNGLMTTSATAAAFSGVLCKRFWLLGSVACLCGMLIPVQGKV